MDEIGWKLPVISQVAAPALTAFLSVAGQDAFKTHAIYALNFKALTYCSGDPLGASAYAQFAERLKAFDPPNGAKIAPSSASFDYDDVLVFKAAAEGAKTLDGPAMAAWLEQNADQVEVTSGVLSKPANGVRQLFGETALGFTLHPDEVRDDRLTPRAGC